jgi:hypothetical protein
MLRRCICGDDKQEDDTLLVEKLEHYKQQEDNRQKIEAIRREIVSENEIVVLDMNNYDSSDFSESVRFRNKVICIVNGRDQFFLRGNFPKTKVLFLFGCDKNFVYYNLTKSNFPELCNLYSDSHPCEYSVMHRHQNNLGYVGYLTPNYYDHYLDIWWDKDIPHIQEMKEEDMLKIRDSYKRVNLEDL